MIPHTSWARRMTYGIGLTRERRHTSCLGFRRGTPSLPAYPGITIESTASYKRRKAILLLPVKPQTPRTTPTLCKDTLAPPPRLLPEE